MREIQTLVIGGGISGLTSAWQLAYAGEDVQLWEAGSDIGGKIATHHDNGWTSEQSASMVLNFRPEVSQFLRDTRLDDYKLLRTPTAKRYLIHQGTLQEMPLKMSGMLFSPIWSLPGKLRLMIEPFILKGAKNNESVADFIRRRLGNEMLDKAHSAYISGTLASDPELADSAAVLPHLTALEQRYGSLTAGVFARKVLHKKKA
ncbi:MAG: protoporphyrinogen oxidase, partial [Methylococcales bacterium]|nr:protoporphyrinogen oxidase [Methylococcales bacterium]